MSLSVRQKTGILLFMLMITFCLSFYSCGGDYSSGETVQETPEDPDEQDPDEPDDPATGTDEEIDFAISQPKAGTIVNGTIKIIADVTAGTVGSIEFYINDTKKATEISAPYEYDWDTTVETNGSYSIKVIVYDDNGKNQENVLTVSVDNAAPDTTSPIITGTMPATGSFVKGEVIISARISDNVDVSSVEFFIDNESKTAVFTAPDLYEFTWDSTGNSNGEHTISFKARDAADNETETLATDIKIFLLNRDETDCPGSNSTWDMTGIWTTTVDTEEDPDLPDTVITLYINQKTPCDGNIFTSWGYDPDLNEFVSLPGIISGNKYTLTTDSWPRKNIALLTWLQTDEISWTPYDNGNSFTGITKVTLYYGDKPSNAVHSSNEKIPDYNMEGVRID